MMMEVRFAGVRQAGPQFPGSMTKMKLTFEVKYGV